jgi:hypothetical protein
MKFRAISLTAGLAFGALVAASALASAKIAPKTHEVVAKVIGVDLQLKSIEIAVGSRQSQTFLVVGKAAERLDQLPIGRMFKLTIQDGGDPTQQVVVAIKRAKNSLKT